MGISEENSPPIHGGQLNAAALKYNIPHENWIDLSTGINPNGWPVPALPNEIFQRLPENNDELNLAAQTYYQADNFIAVAGSQACIQLLPFLRSRSRVTTIHPGYQEHSYCWHSAGHDVNIVKHENVDAALVFTDVLVIINPNNPTGKTYSTDEILAWHAQLKAKKGWLIIDEAFIDGESNQSLIKFSQAKGLIVLRSVGKFFGLAGLRVGFVFAATELLSQLAHRLGPWSISTPSRYIATHALQDKEWQIETRIKLQHNSKRLAQLMSQHGLKPDGGTHLFQWLGHKKSAYLFDKLAQQGVLVRLFKDSSSLRLGLPRDEKSWLHLQATLARISHE